MDLLGECYDVYTSNLEILDAFINLVDHHVLDILRTKRKQIEYSENLKHKFELKQALREQFDENAAAAAVAQFTRLENLSKSVYDLFRKHANASLYHWGEMPENLRTALHLCREQLVQRVRKLDVEHRTWLKDLTAKSEEVRRFIGDVSNYFLQGWDKAVKDKWFFNSKEYTKLSVGYELVEGRPSPLKTLKWFREYALGPAVETYAGIVTVQRWLQFLEDGGGTARRLCLRWQQLWSGLAFAAPYEGFHQIRPDACVVGASWRR
jgi:hypothetical protein